MQPTIRVPSAVKSYWTHYDLQALRVCYLAKAESSKIPITGVDFAIITIVNSASLDANLGLAPLSQSIWSTISGRVAVPHWSAPPTRNQAEQWSMPPRLDLVPDFRCLRMPSQMSPLISWRGPLVTPTCTSRFLLPALVRGDRNHDSARRHPSRRRRWPI